MSLLKIKKPPTKDIIDVAELEKILKIREERGKL
jgi:hypothetical protein